MLGLVWPAILEFSNKEKIAIEKHINIFGDILEMIQGRGHLNHYGPSYKSPVKCWPFPHYGYMPSLHFYEGTLFSLTIVAKQQLSKKHQ